MPKKPVNHYEHTDKLPNNPTQELSGFAENDDFAPTRYPRDTALDPQLVWKGKDQQNDSDLEVQAVPIYIQEHIQPQAIIETIRAHNQKESNQIASLFEGFNDLDFEQKIEFYQHEQNWHNRFILGDSLAVMNSLAEKEGFKNGVQMIYFDPPYGIKFGSNWQVSTRKRAVSDTKAEDVTPQPEQVKAFRDTWELGIHSYLAYLRDRLIIARELLSDSGSLFVQISDENVHLVRCLLDEIFGSDNFVNTITWTRGGMTSSTSLSAVFDYLLWYSKDKEQMKYNQLWLERDERKPDPLLGTYTHVELEDGTRRGMKSEEIGNPALLPKNSKRFATYRVTSQTGGSATYSYEFQGKTFTPPGSTGWRTSRDGLDRLAKQARLTGTGLLVYYIRYASDFPGRAITNMWTDTGQGRSGKSYVVETNPKVIQRCILMTTGPGDLVLDPTCGSGTTAYVAEQWGRRWITVDTSKVALALARTRLMSAKYPYYRLEDAEDIKQGFLHKTAPYVSLSDMANNLEIDDIHAEYAEKLDPIRAEMNRLAGENWEEWEVPAETDTDWDTKLQKLHRKWFDLKRERQLRMDASTARRAKSETLYDQPYQDNKRVRVTGPFTVEGLSPNFSLDTNEAEGGSPTMSVGDVQDYHRHIIEHLKTAGVQNRFKEQRINFDWIEEYPGECIHAEAARTNEDGKTESIAISIGPQYDTVGKRWMQETAKEAVKKITKYDLLIVAGFAFEGYTAGEDTRIGSLPILPIRMGRELMVRELKNTGEGNLFMVIGEPDIEIDENEDDTISVKLLGVDVYDPAKGGDLRSRTPEDIACWFIDTAYNGEAFMVRHAYFTGENEPYKQLQKALKAEINEEAWEALYRIESLPFAKPESGKIAVKVINHFGDEVVKEYKV
ncbi:site-specific DNA-methyltransferase [Candidatus Poribacteria bacterium]|nr:site-specific DNA-methyltransferase [Candidatus Poribacteria bacterium]